MKTPLFRPGYQRLFVLVIALFFLWGMSNNLTDILVQQFKKSFELSAAQAQLVQTAVFFGYFFMALPAAIAMRRFGYKAGILAGLVLFGCGTLLFWPAAVVGKYSWMLTALFVVGCGSATLETAANPFMAEAGPAASSERRLNLAQAFNPPGTITGVLIGAFFIFSGVELSQTQVGMMKAQHTYQAYLHAELMRVVPTYVTLGCAVLLLAFVLALTQFPPANHPDEHVEPLLPQLSALVRTPALLAAIVAQFAYCGAQVTTWSTFIPYVKQYTGVTERTAALLLTGNLVALALGRLLSTGLMRWFRPSRMLALYAAINIGLVLLGALYPGRTGAGALLFSSFFMSIMFPTIFALGIKGLGARTKLAGSLIVMAILGAGVIPPIAGLLVSRTGSYAMGFLVVLACYGVVLIYAALAKPAAVTIDNATL